MKFQFALLAIVSVVLLTNGLEGVKGEGEYKWKRSALIYHEASRTEDKWKRHLVRISENGGFTSKWLFDHAIITSEQNMGGVDSADILNNLLQTLLQDAKALDSSMQSLSRPSTTFKISIGCPFVRNTNPVITLDGKAYHPNNVTERLGIQKWYIKKVNDFRLSNTLKYSEILGIYYHQEDASPGDVPSIQGFNSYIHELGMQSVWVPYYSAPYAFEGRSTLGFDVVVIQPSYAFSASFDGGNVKGDRLYTLGQKSAEIQQCYEYEVRGGETKVDSAIAHQYLAVAQDTGAWKFPQVFFAGGATDIFDKLESKTVADSTYGIAWQTYSELADYLEGKIIKNLEAKIPINPNKVKRMGGMDFWETKWIVTQCYSGLSSVRLDFQENPTGYWSGSVYVYIERLDGTTASSFTHRWGPDSTLSSANSVFVPLADKNVTDGSLLTIIVEKPITSSWPTFLRMVAAKNEPLYIANPLFEEVAYSSNSCPAGTYSENLQSHKGYQKGYLTDGKVSPGGWYWSGIVGISKNQFFVIIDLGKVVDISKIQIWAHDDSGSGVSPPINLVGLVSTSCFPHVTGTTELNCIADATSVKQSIKVLDNTQDIVISLPFLETVRGRYVSVAGISPWLVLLDEIQVIDNNNAVVSNGTSYRLSPMTGTISGNNYCDNGRRLTDGIVMSEFIFAVSPYDGLQGNNTYVEVLLDTPKLAKYAVVWMSQADYRFGVQIPSSVNIKWRNTNNVWSGDNIVVPMTEQQCGPTPCAKLQLPSNTKITGIRAIFPNVGLIMITEISIV